MTPVIDVLDWFSGAGGTSTGFLRTNRFRVLVAANHSPRACETYGYNNPTVDVRQADLHYADPEDFPPARVLISTPCCTNHTGSNAKRLYLEGPSIFNEDAEDEEMEDALLQERSRATMSCSLRYARRHRPEFVIHENVVEAAWWGIKMPGKNRGDGSTFRWWVRQWENLGYEVEVRFVNAKIFGAPQSRDRMIMVCRRRDVPKANLVFEPECWCPSCERVVEGRQTWKKRTKAWPLHQWGRLGPQYFYRCPTCHSQSEPLTNGAFTIIDWSNLGLTFGERKAAGKGLANSTEERARRCLERFDGAEPFVMLTRNKSFGTDARVSDPMRTITKRHDQALVTPPAFVVELRGGGSVVSGQRPVREPLGTVTAKGTHHALLSMPAAFWGKNNGNAQAARYHPVTEPFGTFTGIDSTTLVTVPNAFLSPYYSHSTPSHVADPVPTITTVDRFGLVQPLGAVELDYCHVRMLTEAELQAGQTFPVEYDIKGSKREVVQQIGDAVPCVLAYAFADRIADALDGTAA